MAVLALGKRWGVVVNSSSLQNSQGDKEFCQRLKEAKAPSAVCDMARGLWQSWQQAIKQEQVLYKQVCRLAEADPEIKRAGTLPGYGPIRAATMICYLDTPHRFHSKSALWRYVGIGLQREQSGQQMDRKCVDQTCNRLLRGVAIGAAQSVINLKENVFARRYTQWICDGVSPMNARRNVARYLVTVLWGMWKSKTDFDPSRLSALD